MNPNYNCPECNGTLVDSDQGDWECERCGCAIQEEGDDELLLDREPDKHGGTVYVYERNHATEGQSHE